MTPLQPGENPRIGTVEPLEESSVDRRYQSETEESDWMADLGKLQSDVYCTQQDARWIVQSFRDLAPKVRNVGGKLFGGSVQWIKPNSDGVFAGVDSEPDFAVNAFFPAARGYKARNEAIGYTLKLSVWDEGEKQRRVVISSQASRQGDRPQASRARRKLLAMLSQADTTITPFPS